MVVEIFSGIIIFSLLAKATEYVQSNLDVWGVTSYSGFSVLAFAALLVILAVSMKAMFKDCKCKKCK